MQSLGVVSQPVCAQLEARHRHYLRAYENGDVAALLAAFTPEAALIEPDKAPIHGREAIGAELSAWFERFSFSRGRVALWECGMEEGTAWDLSYFELEATHRESGDGFLERWKQLSLWQRDDSGSWLLHRLMFNSHCAEN